MAYVARRLAVDTGGTFTDLVVEGTDGLLRSYKSPSTPDDPGAAVLTVLEAAAAAAETSAERFLAPAEMLIHGTTRAINAILTQTTARTALLTTEGHADVLVFREGGRTGVFDFSRPYPRPYVRRALTFEIPERIGPAGEIVKQLDAVASLEVIQELKRSDVEAVAVCLLWSIANPTHELLIGELLEAHLPGIPYTLSHRVNPALREYRRASSSSIDASLKPVMTAYLRDLEQRLRGVGFSGRVLVVTSNGGVVDAADVAEAPILSINSGPAMAPVAGRHYAQLEGRADTAIIADTGGTSYDVSLVREGRIPKTRETWIGPPYFGHVTGLPSVDVKSVGAGGGSIARVDAGGLLHVGPDSAGSVPGPVCYGRGGERPTVTDAALVLGYLDPAYFLAGKMALDTAGAHATIEEEIAEPLDLGVDDAAAAIVELATEHMVHAIEDITINQGIDPRDAVLVGGGGAAGLNAVAIARRLGCPEVAIPEVGAVLSAAGALLSDLATEFDRHLATSSTDFDLDRANEVLEQLEAQCLEFIAGPGSGSTRSTIEFSVEARYPDQAWELEVPLRSSRLRDAADVDVLCGDFHALHQQVFAISDPRSPIEIVTWRARASCVLRDEKPIRVARPVVDRPPEVRLTYFPGHGAVEVPVRHLDAMQPPARVSGPAILESSFTTVVVDPWASATLKEDGRLAIDPLGAAEGAEGAKQPLPSASQPQLR